MASRATLWRTSLMAALLQSRSAGRQSFTSGEKVAEQRRSLPLGGEAPEDYVFEGERGSV